MFWKKVAKGFGEFLASNQRVFHHYYIKTLLLFLPLTLQPPTLKSTNAHRNNSTITPSFQILHKSNLYRITPPMLPHRIAVNVVPPKEIELKIHGLINNFKELSGEEYAHRNKEITGHKAWCIGLALHLCRTAVVKTEMHGSKNWNNGRRHGCGRDG